MDFIFANLTFQVVHVLDDYDTEFVIGLPTCFAKNSLFFGLQIGLSPKNPIFFFREPIINNMLNNW